MSLSERIKRLAGLADQPGRPRARVLAVAAQKGGVGKTTTAVNLSVALARFANQRTLLVDLDGQGHVATSLASIYEDGSPVSMSDVLLGHGRDLLEIVHPTRIDLLSVTPSDKGLASAEGVLAGRIGKEFLLRSALKKARERFDMIVLDCPPNLGNLTLNALMAADACLVPCDMSVLAMAGVADLLAVVETLRDRLDHSVHVLGVLPTRVDRRNARVTDAVLHELADTYGELVMDSHIPVSSALARAQMEGVPVFDYAPSASGSLAYRALSQEVLARLGLDLSTAS
jgi:chromosome partitioning protein